MFQHDVSNTCLFSLPVLIIVFTRCSASQLSCSATKEPNRWALPMIAPYVLIAASCLPPTRWAAQADGSSASSRDPGGVPPFSSYKCSSVDDQPANQIPSLSLPRPSDLQACSTLFLRCFDLLSQSTWILSKKVKFSLWVDFQNPVALCVCEAYWSQDLLPHLFKHTLDIMELNSPHHPHISLQHC